MRPSAVEEWALRIIAGLQQGRPIEDSRVELKRTWPDPDKAARRIAGHANAAQGEEILWLMGVSENGTLPGLDAAELANWWPQVRAHMRPPFPEAQPVTLYSDDDVALALLIDTSRAPYLVKNPAFGTPGGGPVEFEVPWRDMTAVRTARHEDLIRLLVPRAQLPTIEVIKADLKTEGVFEPYSLSVDRPSQSKKNTWMLSVTLYLVPRDASLVVLPAHRCRIKLSEPCFVEMVTGTQQRDSTGVPSPLDDVVIERARHLELLRPYTVAVGLHPTVDRVMATFTFVPAGETRNVAIDCPLERTSEWTFSFVTADA